MHRQIAPLLLLLLILTLSPPAGTAPTPAHEPTPASFRVEGAVEHPGDWTVERLKKELAGQIRTISYTLKGEQDTAHCVPLLALIRAAEPHLNPKVKNHLLAFVVVLRAEDGYSISFSLGELLPEFGKEDVFLALERNGKPLSEEEGPVRLIVPGDSKPARWLHGIAHIVLIDGFQPEPKQAADSRWSHSHPEGRL